MMAMYTGIKYSPIYIIFKISIHSPPPIKTYPYAMWSTSTVKPTWLKKHMYLNMKIKHNIHTKSIQIY